MSETLDAINSAPEAAYKRSTARKGTAPAIRKLKAKYPEMTEAAIAKRVGCSPSNVHRVISSYNKNTSEESLRDFQENKADIIDSVTHNLLTHFTEAKMKKMSGSQLAIAVGIMIDKAQLLHGLPTSINVSVLHEVIDAIRDRSTMPVAPSISVQSDGDQQTAASE